MWLATNRSFAKPVWCNEESVTKTWSLLAMIVTISFIVLCKAEAQPQRAGVETVSSSEIVELAATDIACLGYQVAGGCLWMTCTPYGCEYDESLRVEHRIPEVVIAAYPFIGRSSWVDTRHYARSESWAEEGGASDEGGDAEREQALKFKNTDVIGSPALMQFWAAYEADSEATFCKPYTYPMLPYFLSTLDPSWRDPLFETPWTLRHILWRIGHGSAQFAYMFPRTGFINNSHDYKASFVAARRAFDIVRQRKQPHHYMPLDFMYQGQQGQWPPANNPFVDNSEDPLWQQLVPYPMSCRGLPDIDDVLSVPSDPYRSRLNQVYGNAWQVWRPYSCCKQAGATLIAYF